MEINLPQECLDHCPILAVLQTFAEDDDAYVEETLLKYPGFRITPGSIVCTGCVFVAEGRARCRAVVTMSSRPEANLEDS
jgi:hypothetical protein